MKNAFLLGFLSVTAFAPALGAASIVLSDQFNDTTIDNGLWNALAPLSDSQIYESGGTANFFQRGVLITQNDLPDAIQIDARFAFVGAENDQLSIATRFNGTLIPPYYPWNSSIGITLSRKGGDDHSTMGVNNVYLSGGDFALTSFLFLTNVFYDLRIVDTGTHLSLYINDLVTPLLETDTALRTGNRLGLMNRGTVPWFPTYNNALKLDYITVTDLSEPVPDGGMTVVYLGLAGVILFFRRKTRN